MPGSSIRHPFTSQSIYSLISMVLMTTEFVALFSIILNMLVLYACL